MCILFFFLYLLFVISASGEVKYFFYYSFVSYIQQVLFLAFFLKKLAGLKKISTFAFAIERDGKQKLNGALVQLVRIHACHAWGHEFESRTHRKN